MKRLADYTDTELVALGDDQIGILIDIECAEEGIPLLPPYHGLAPTWAKPPFDCTAYTIAGLCVLSSEQATAILTAFSSAPLFTTNYPEPDSSTKYLKPVLSDAYNVPEVKAVQCYSPELWDSVKNEYQAFKLRFNAWEAKANAYAEAIKLRSEISDYVWKIIADTHAASLDRANLVTEFDRYLVLAEGSTSIAMAFLKKTRNLDRFPGLEEELLGR